MLLSRTVVIALVMRFILSVLMLFTMDLVRLLVNAWNIMFLRTSILRKKMKPSGSI